MVAEALPETEALQPNAETQSDPNPATEPEAAAENEETSYDDILTNLLADPATEAGDGKATSADETGPPEKVLTPDEIREQTRRDVERENAQKQTDYQRQQQLNGIRRSFASLDDDLDKILTEELGVTDLNQIKRVKARVQQHNGHWNELYQNDVQGAQAVTKTAMREALIEAGKKFTGEKEFDPGTSLDEYAERIAEHARKGYKSPSEIKAERTDAQKVLLKRLDAMGVVIPSQRALNVPNNPGTGNGTDPTYQRIQKMSPQQIAAMDDTAFLKAIEGK